MLGRSVGGVIANTVGNAQFPATMEQLVHMLAHILGYARALGFDKDKLGQIELAAEEALVNVIVHAYAGRQDGRVEITCESLNPKALQIILKDQGVPFDPTTQNKGFDPEAAILAGAEGGFGIFLMLKVMDEVNYRYNDGYNILTLIKRY